MEFVEGVAASVSLRELREVPIDCLPMGSGSCGLWVVGWGSGNVWGGRNLRQKEGEAQGRRIERMTYPLPADT